MIVFEPEVINYNNKKEYLSGKKRLQSKYPLAKYKDLYESLVFEDFVTNNPSVYFKEKTEQKKEFLKKKGQIPHGSLLYNQFLNEVFHLVNRDSYILLRTIRNRGLITKDQQLKLYNKTVAVAGLSVGINILLSMIRFGIGNKYKIADYDEVALSNFNRAFYDLDDYGISKISSAAKKISSLDPFIKLDLYNEGLNEGNLDSFLEKVDVIIDAFDNFKTKIELRRKAKQLKIPVVSCFDIEEGALIIVERYDLDKDLNLNVFLNKQSFTEISSKPLTPKQKTDKFVKIIGKKYHSKQMLTAVYDVGKNLTGYPQLIIATLLASSAITSVVKDILLGKKIKSSRKYLSVL